MKTNSRRTILKSGLVFAGGILTASASLARHLGDVNMQDKPAPLAPELVKEFVIAGHGNLAKTKEMLEQQPGLLNASWDWGGGDFESAIEGAGHVGNRELAEFLLSKGARASIFCAAMLGKLDIVQSTLTAFPNLKTSKGPHGLMLLHHAQKGGEIAKPVFEYLTSIGAS
jgi:hypothetical protein